MGSRPSPPWPPAATAWRGPRRAGAANAPGKGCRGCLQSADRPRPSQPSLDILRGGPSTRRAAARPLLPRAGRCFFLSSQHRPSTFAYRLDTTALSRFQPERRLWTLKSKIEPSTVPLDGFGGGCEESVGTIHLVSSHTAGAAWENEP